MNYIVDQYKLYTLKNREKRLNKNEQTQKPIKQE